MRAALVICMAALLLQGCGGSTYRYGGKAYRNADQALAAARESNAKMVAQIAPAKNRVGGTLVIYVPNKDSVIERGVRKTGEPRQESLDYVAETIMLRNQSLHQALVQRNSFDDVTLHYSDGGHIAPKAGERVVYLYQPGVDNSGWFFASAAVNRERIHFDMTKADASARVQYWIESIEALAKIK
jgi:hypothetical protein